MRKAAIVFFAVTLAGALQSQMADRIGVFGANPDFLIAVTMAMALLLDPVMGGLFGLAAGLVHASIVGFSFGGFLISRTLLGYITASLRSWVFQENPFVLLAAALLGTIFCEGVYFLIDPSGNPVSLISQLPMQSVYNALIAMACYALIKRAMREERPQAA